MAVDKTDSEYTNIKTFYGYRAENEVNLSLRKRIAAALGYDPLNTASVPEEANIGEGCGNPLLIANLVEVCNAKISRQISTNSWVVVG